MAAVCDRGVCIDLSGCFFRNGHMAAFRRSNDWNLVSFCQQNYKRGNWVRRQLGNFDSGGISGYLGACRSFINCIFHPGRIFCGCFNREENGGKMQASVLPVSCGRIFNGIVYRRRGAVRGYTVEMSYLMPVVLLVIMSSIFGIFYFYDKNIISGAAYETAVVGSTKAREGTGVEREELEALFYERTGNKCILFDRIQVSVSVSNEKIEILGTGTSGGMRVSVLKCMPVTEPEKRIRDIRRLKGAGNGKENND